jgi:hypothetical protein
MDCVEPVEKLVIRAIYGVSVLGWASWMAVYAPLLVINLAVAKPSST